MIACTQIRASSLTRHTAGMRQDPIVLMWSWPKSNMVSGWSAVACVPKRGMVWGNYLRLLISTEAQC